MLSFDIMGVSIIFLLTKHDETSLSDAHEYCRFKKDARKSQSGHTTGSSA